MRERPRISVHFDHCWFQKDNPDNPNQYWNPTDSLEKLWITDDWGKKVGYDVEKTIVIHCLRDGDQHDSPIKITAKPLGIEFIESDYPYDNGREVHYCRDRTITSIDIDSTSAVFTATDGLCKIDVDDP